MIQAKKGAILTVSTWNKFIEWFLFGCLIVWGGKRSHKFDHECLLEIFLFIKIAQNFLIIRIRGFS